VNDPIVLSLQDLVTHHMCEFDAWRLSQESRENEAQKFICKNKAEWHLQAATLLLDTIKELKQYANNGTGSGGQPVTNSNSMGEG
jgi:hypothetical protein